MSTEVYFALILIGIALIAYITLDGYDIGIGLWLPLQSTNAKQRVLVSVIDTVWDGNESWIILIGTLLWGGFPGIYATVLPDNYLLFIGVILGFILRGVSLEFQDPKNTTYEKILRFIFVASSWLLVICQGAIVGNLITPFFNPAFINPVWIKVLVVLLLVFLYSVNGMNRQYEKTSGVLEDDAKKYGKIFTIALLVILSVLLLIMAQNGSLVLRLGETRKTVLLIVAGFIIGILLFIIAYYSNSSLRKAITSPFIFSFLLCSLLVIGIGVFMFPYISPAVPLSQEVSASQSGLVFLVSGVSLTFPIVLWYNLYAAKVFRGKQTTVTED